MNTKYKTAATGAVSRTLGRPVGVLPLGPRSAVPPSQRKPNSIDRRPLKRTPSNGSQISLSSARSTVSNSSLASYASSKKSTCRKDSGDGDIAYHDEANEGQDVKFIDSDALSRPSSTKSQKSSRQEKKTLTTSDILELSQETEPYKVYEVDLHAEDLTTPPDLEKFRKLRVLDLSGNHIKRITGLDFNKDLRELKLYDNSISTIEGLENLKELCILQLQHNQISSLGRGLGNLKKLQTLRLDNNHINKLDTPELLSCSHITTLDLSSNKLETLAPLNYLPNLEELFVAGNQIRKTGDLTKCKKLQEVDLSRNRIDDLSGFANLPNLQIMDVSHNQLTTLKSVGKLRSLEELNVNANRVADLTSFAGAFPKLQILFACDNMISAWDEICSLSGLPDLVELFVSANPFTMEDGEMPAYHHTITLAIPNLEVIDGIQIKKASGKQGAPLMRPMSAASIISVKQVDTQLKAATVEQESMHKSISERFESLRTLVHSLPSEAPHPKTVSEHSLLSSRCSSRSRIKEARAFAAVNFDDDDDDDLA